MLDAGRRLDAGAHDAGTPRDSGIAYDAGAQRDASASYDAGPAPDAEANAIDGEVPDGAAAAAKHVEARSAQPGVAGSRPDAYLIMLDLLTLVRRRRR